MSSRAGSKTQPADVKRAAVITHGKPETIGSALDRLRAVAAERDIELLFPDEEADKHGLGHDGDLADLDLAVVLGGDGTMLRGLQRFLGMDVPVIGVNFGRVGFLASIASDALEEGLARAFSGEYVDPTAASVPSRSASARSNSSSSPPGVASPSAAGSCSGSA